MRLSIEINPYFFKFVPLESGPSNDCLSASDEILDDTDIRSNLLYKSHQISKLKCFSIRLTVFFAQSIEASCWVENEYVVGATPAGDAPTTSEWSTVLIPTMVRPILGVLR